MSNFGFPFFSPPFPKATPTSPPHPPCCSPPPPTFPPTPPRKLAPPPPPAPKLAPPPPQIAPPPSKLVPPPPHIAPPAPHAPHDTVIIMACVSLGGLFFLAFLAAGVCSFIKKKKLEKKMMLEADMVSISDRVHVHETVVQQPHGEPVVAMTVDEDISVQGMRRKNEVDAVGKSSGFGVVANTRS